MKNTRINSIFDDIVIKDSTKIIEFGGWHWYKNICMPS
jgi:hypothetical protein